MLKYHIKAAFLLIALLMAHEIEGFSMCSQETALTSLQIGIFLSNINYYCYAKGIITQVDTVKVQDEQALKKSILSQTQNKNGIVSSNNTDLMSNSKSNVMAIETSYKASTMEDTDIYRKEVQNIEKKELNNSQYRSTATVFDTSAKKRKISNSKSFETV
uniref:Uncharacterized protein n=1 Tax=Glossina brevipalpis TaxID=37001 RepID=A0A1A9X5Q7_9MUSC